MLKQYFERVQNEEALSLLRKLHIFFKPDST